MADENWVSGSGWIVKGPQAETFVVLGMGLRVQATNLDQLCLIWLAV